MRIETLAVHAGHDVDPTTAAVTPPIHLSTTFAREADGTLLTLSHSQFFDEGARDRHRDGWSGTLEKLDRFLTA